MTKLPALQQWVDEMARMCAPDKVVWIDGSEAEKARLEKEAISTGEMLLLNQEKMPGCLYHRTNPNDVARTEHLTFICTSKKEDAGVTNNWMSPQDAYKRAGDIFRNSMKGRTMYVIPFSMGPLGSPLTKYAVQLTDSIYVVLNMRIMTRMGAKVLEHIEKIGTFTKCLHGKADLNLERRLILHLPEDNTIWSVGSGYGGNVLLGKKCLSLRIASYLAKEEGWLAEHMLILGIEDPKGKISYVAGAFPSACGKTNLAMLIPPAALKGYKVWTVGDDIAWMKIGKDGRLRAINPENGFFGVVPGTNMKTNPNAMRTITKNTIYTNVLLKEDKTVWWEGHDDAPPAKGIDWKGDPWTPGQKNADGTPAYGAHPNSRFTAPCYQCPSIAKNWEDPEGVPIDAFIFGGRRARVAPLVYESLNWEHGVYVGATMASERTAAQYGKQGEVRRDPMAMLPFCGYNMADYFAHWLKMGKNIPHPPKIFNVNWFRRDEQNKFLWPGYGDNLRVLLWIIDRCNGKGEAKETPIGYVPTAKAINTEGLDVNSATMEKLLDVSTDDWKQELNDHDTFFKTFGDRLPGKISEEYNSLKKRFGL